jgi:DNA repair protein SbcC/Rad50
MPLSIKHVLIRNFRSFGDYDTIVKLDGLGGTLIVGENVHQPNDPNGAGKTSLLDALIWCLFGRVPTRAKPGDTIVNWVSKQNCIVEIVTTDGYTITRTRGVDGHDDLLIKSPDGKDESLSTNPNTQIHLNKIFNLDYDIFMSSVFFAQFGQPFLELPDQKRKKALERMLHLTKYDVVAEVAKEKIAATEEEQKKAKILLSTHDSHIIRETQRLEATNANIREHDAKREADIVTIENNLSKVEEIFKPKYAERTKRIADAREELNAIELQDIANLKKEWAKHDARELEIQAEQSEIDTLIESQNSKRTEKETLAKNTFKIDYDAKIAVLVERKKTVQAELEAIEIPDIDDLKARWQKHEKSTKALQEAAVVLQEHKDKRTKARSEKELLQEEIERWKGLEGQICPECKQQINGEHIHSVTNPDSEKMTEIDAELASIETTITTIKQAKDKLEAKIEGEKPVLTLRHAETIIAQRASKQKEIDTLENQIETTKQDKTQAATNEAKRQTRMQLLEDEISQLEIEKENIQKNVLKAIQILEESRPMVTVAEAELIKKQYDAKFKEIKTLEESVGQIDEQKTEHKENLKKKIQELREGVNPYKKIYDDLKTDLDKLKVDRDQQAKIVEKYDKLINHLEYIRSSYRDRNKIKSLTIGKLIPFLNQRIAYYLDAFECDAKIEFNPFLQLKSGAWPYDQYSGGERKRIDIALMFAIYDLHASIYEQRCNILVLDEVDGRLSEGGIHKLINLLYKEFIDSEATNRPRTLLIISHRNEMRDAFPNKIVVTKEDKLSRIMAS